MFSKVLIANRGEIAVRIAQTLHEMGIEAVAVYSEPDRAAHHVACADEAYPLAGATAAETYLRGAAIIEIAKAHGAQAIHPGYGFLSENAGFAGACADAGLTFIGPGPEAIRVMGDKVAAKARMVEAGVPVVPGAAGVLDEGGEALAAEAGRIGYPVLVKAAAGGGGRGMRMVADPAELDAAVDAARREARASFGDARVFLERYVERARHVEVQVFADAQGRAVSLFERDCSIQRRHQKLIEESPAPGLSGDVRCALADAAVRAAEAIGYTNAGTVEFLLDPSGDFAFLEMNTRLQVEHAVTEVTVGHDLVRLQVEVAAGEPLAFLASPPESRGHAIECRICAEDAARDFVPSTGVVEVFDPPAGPGVRVDTGIRAGSEVTVHYDPMLAKLIVLGATRGEAIARMIAALDRFVILGVTTNIEFLRAVLDHDAFRAGDVHTHFLDEHAPALRTPLQAPPEAWIAAALTAAGPDGSRSAESVSARRSQADPDPWTAGGAWRIGS